MSRLAKATDEAYEWRQETKDAFLSGEVSATRLQRMVHKASKAGAKGADDFAKTGKSGSIPNNIHRDLANAMRRGSLWPKFYYAAIPLWDPKEEKMIEKSHPFLLPHEWLAKACDLCDMSGIMATENHTDIHSHMAKVCAGLRIPVEGMIPLGLHSDGVPFGSQNFYTDSLELFSLNFPCGNIGMRIPFTSVQKTHLVKHVTYNAILQVLAWSLKHLALGILPTHRHDGTEFGPGELWRLKMSVRPAKALLVEIRADWVALKQLFQFPQQNENAGICWMCSCKPSDVQDCSSNAPWRRERKTAVSFHRQLLSEGKSCPLWSVPGVSCAIVVVDWLHCADIGVTADIMGNILVELLPLYPGSDRNVRMKALWQEVRDEYDSQGVPEGNRFPVLRVQSFCPKGKSPKLKGKAAHIRYFVPVLDCIVQRKLDPTDSLHNQTVVSCMQNLAMAYSCLQDFDPVKLDRASRRMALLYCALQKEQVDAGVDKRWKVKPKLHLFLELCHYLCLQRQRGNPRDFWTYGDESHGGSMRRIAASRGGKNSSAASAYRLLSLWVSQTAFLSMMD